MGGTAQPHQRTGDKILRRDELEAHIALIGKAGVAGDAGVDVLTPGANLIGRDWRGKIRGHHASHEPAHKGTGAFDQGLSRRAR